MGASQGELRRHGCFHEPTDDRGGCSGCPSAAAAAGARAPAHGSAAVLFLAVHQLRFARLDGLEAGPEAPDDRCVVSCVDCDGNAR